MVHWQLLFTCRENGGSLGGRSVIFQTHPFGIGRLGHAVTDNDGSPSVNAVQLLLGAAQRNLWTPHTPRATLPGRRLMTHKKATAHKSSQFILSNPLAGNKENRRQNNKTMHRKKKLQYHKETKNVYTNLEYITHSPFHSTHTPFFYISLLTTFTNSKLLGRPTRITLL